MINQILHQYLFAATCGIILMIFTFFIALKIKFFSVVDVAWSYGFAFLALAMAIFSPGDESRKYLLFVMTAIWSFRLGTHLAIRLKGHYPEEDGRYKQLRSQWAASLNSSFFKFYMFQGISIAILAAPWVFVTLNPTPGLGVFEIAGVIVWIIAIAGESIADKQLANFKADKSNKGKTCDVGLWKYSRHPNYFFEWLIWCSYFLYACGSPLGFISIYCPITMLFLLLKVTGIPATEAQSLKSRGNEYKRYQEKTSMFIPWFSKK